jgi:hypothetical protein
MNPSCKVLALIFAGASLLLLCPGVHATVIDWDTLAWAPGSTSNSYDVDPANAGSDVTISVGGNNTLTNDATTGIPSPAITMSLTGGLSPAQNTFEIAANLHTKSKVSLAVNFSPQYLQGVTNVSFSIFDIDRGTNNDQIKGIYGIALDGTHVAATITNLGSVVSLNGSGLAQVLVGGAASANDSSNGNATISFGGVAITGFAFTFANNAGAPRYQDISISDIFFTPIPEMNPAGPMFMICVAAAAIEWRRRQAQRKTLALDPSKR